MTTRQALAQENPGALLYPVRYDGALLGVTLGFGTKSDTKPVAVYDHTRLLEILAAEFAKDDARDGEEREDEERYDDAEEWINYNMAGAYLGPNAPVIVDVAVRACLGSSEACHQDCMDDKDEMFGASQQAPKMGR